MVLEDATWNNVGEQIWASLIIQLVFVCLGMLLRLVFNRTIRDTPVVSLLNLECSRKERLTLWLSTYIGTNADPPRSSVLVSTLFVLEFLSSTLVAVLWVLQAYQEQVMVSIKALTIVMSIFFIFHYFVHSLKDKFHPRYRECTKH